MKVELFGALQLDEAHRRSRLLRQQKDTDLDQCTLGQQVVPFIFILSL